ncbi:hypothetical protein [Flavobacterium sp.]|jgi:hypothetical protein|uniref:hypothetical protein n=1 Tax=Flavobacterium sp. TaxID=239 RepID=UPI0037C07D15
MAVATSGPSDKPISDKKGVGGRGMQAYSPAYRAEQKAAKQRPAGMTGSADAMERKITAAKKGRSSFGKNQGAIQGGATEDPYAWLRDLLGGGGGGGGSRRAYSDEQIAATQAKLQAIYNRYADDIAAREADIAAQYTQTGTNLGGIYDTAVGNINSAYDAARAAQTQQLLNLGMTEQTPVQSFGNQTGATTSLQNLRAAVLAQNEATKNAAITNQRLAAEAGRREGAQTAAQAAAQMASEMVSTGGGGGGGGGLSPYQYASLVLQQQKADAQNQYNAAKLAGQGQRTTPDYNALINQAKQQGMSNSEAINYARLVGG